MAEGEQQRPATERPARAAAAGAIAARDAPSYLPLTQLAGMMNAAPPVMRLRGTSAVLQRAAIARSAGVVQRAVTIGKGDKHGTFDAFSRTDQCRGICNTLLARLKADNENGLSDMEIIALIGAEVREVFNTSEHVTFDNDEEFIDIILYQIEHKSVVPGEHTVQEQYLTRYGWKRRAEAAPVAPAGRGAARGRGGGAARGRGGAPRGGGAPRVSVPAPAASSAGSAAAPRPIRPYPTALKIYRTMDLNDWRAIAANDYAVLVGGHLGDYQQARRYLSGISALPKVLVEFTLRAGAHAEMFSPANMELQRRPTKNTTNMHMALERERGEFGHTATDSEGLAAGKIGIKSEKKGEAGFSLAIGGDRDGDQVPYEVFRSFVATARVLAASNGRAILAGGLAELLASQPGAPGSGRSAGPPGPASGPSALSPPGPSSAPSSAAPLSGSSSAPGGGVDDIVTVMGHRFDETDPRVRAGGHCLWDSLRVHYGYDDIQLRAVAPDLDLTFNQHVADDQVWPLLRALGARGMTLISWPYGRPDEAFATVKGDGHVVLGLVYAPDGNGHYIPPR